jgi:hypothetical protein
LLERNGDARDRYNYLVKDGRFPPIKDIQELSELSNCPRFHSYITDDAIWKAYFFFAKNALKGVHFIDSVIYIPDEPLELEENFKFKTTTTKPKTEPAKMQQKTEVDKEQKRNVELKPDSKEWFVNTARNICKFNEKGIKFEASQEKTLFESFSVDIILLIIRLLDVTSLLQLSLVSKVFYVATSRSTCSVFWRFVISRFSLAK